MSVLLLSYLVSGLLVVLALAAAFRSSRQEMNEKAYRHFVETAGLTIDGSRVKDRRHRPTTIKQMFWRAGLEPQQRHIMIAITITVLLTLMVAISNGVLAGLMVPLLLAILAYMWLWQRANSRIKSILSQLPLFLDQVLRALGTGRSMESALHLAASETPDPLREIFERVLRVNRLGDDLSQSIQQMAELYRVHELYLVSLAIRVNRTYGSSVRDLLSNIVKIIHDREAARRELRTMTGETRVTAWVLGLLPIMIAAYIVMVNPDYMMTMWEDESGRIMLFAALVLQAIGGFTLWRMIKSI